MKYKVGDRVVIKTWEELKGEYGLDVSGDMNSPPNAAFFAREMDRDLNKNFPDRILTIKKIGYDYYSMESLTNWAWSDYMIKGLEVEEKYTMFDPIEKRFELMEL